MVRSVLDITHTPSILTFSRKQSFHHSQSSKRKSALQPLKINKLMSGKTDRSVFSGCNLVRFSCSKLGNGFRVISWGGSSWYRLPRKGRVGRTCGGGRSCCGCSQVSRLSGRWVGSGTSHLSCGYFSVGVDLLCSEIVACLMKIARQKI